MCDIFQSKILISSIYVIGYRLEWFVWRGVGNETSILGALFAKFYLTTYFMMCITRHDIESLTKTHLLPNFFFVDKEYLQLRFAVQKSPVF